jgi:hypothetical protein
MWPVKGGVEVCWVMIADFALSRGASGGELMMSVEDLEVTCMTTYQASQSVMR